MTNKKVFASRIFPECGINLLKEADFLVTEWNEDRPMTQNELIMEAKRHDALFCTVSDKIDKKFLNECSHLDIISQFAVGYDNIDVREATKLGIAVGYTPGAMTDATADIAFSLMIATARKMFYLHKRIINGRWDYFRPNSDLGIELKNKTLGIFGMGRIGMEMAHRCKGAYNMQVIYHDLNRNSAAEKELNARFVDFHSLLAQSDILSVHCQLSEQTRGIFNKEAFGRMKPTSVFINTSRGAVHHEKDLIEALDTGKIWGAGLDVTDPEPMHRDNPLLQMESVGVLPHIGSATVEARNAMSLMAAANIIGYYKDKNVPNLVNPEVLKK
ncbi:MAG: D-glycerate dehydrogenase [Bacteroidales bacterium]|nr:D-glycerate dehydrogenase [Bacteroidales bacterium]